MTARHAHRFPIEPLEDYARRRGYYVGYMAHLDSLERGTGPERDTGQHQVSAASLGALIGVGKRQVARWRGEQAGMLSLAQADRAAIAAGTHPAILWPDEWLADVPAELDLEATL